MRGKHAPPWYRSLASPVAVFLAVAALAFGIRVIGDGFGASATDGFERVGANASATPRQGASVSRTPKTPERGSLVIHGTGDVNLDPTYVTSFQTNGYEYAWSGLDGFFRSDDLTVVNLECAVSNAGTAVAKEFTFRGDPDALPAMRDAGVEVANMANNHSYDFGPEAIVDARENLMENDIAPVGAGEDPEQALAPATFDLKGWRVAVVGFDKVVDPYPDAVASPGHPGTAAGHDLDLMVKTVETVAASSDITIVVIHWGIELDTVPRADDIALAHRFINAGADVIFGHHSHRLQPMRIYKGRPIFYSLGNFVWPNSSVPSATTAVAEVRVTPEGTFKGRLIPAYIEASGHPVLRGT